MESRNPDYLWKYYR